MSKKKIIGISSIVVILLAIVFVVGFNNNKPPKNVSKENYKIFVNQVKYLEKLEKHPATTDPTQLQSFYNFTQEKVSLNQMTTEEVFISGDITFCQVSLMKYIVNNNDTESYQKFKETMQKVKMKLNM